MAIIKRLGTVFFILIIIILILSCCFIYRYDYLSSYREVKLKKIAQYDIITTGTITPRWLSVTTQEKLDNIKEKYNLELPHINFEKDMLIISYGAELVRLDYNLKESTYKTRGSYIGYSSFGNFKQNAIFIYKTQLIPLIDTDVAGVPPDYRGKYRK